jgi:hypothetical protein
VAVRVSHVTPQLNPAADRRGEELGALQWRLDLALRGLASQRLLDTYQAEREPHITEIIRHSIAVGKLVCTTDPEAARRRDEAFWSGQVPPPPAAGLRAVRGRHDPGGQARLQVSTSSIQH